MLPMNRQFLVAGICALVCGLSLPTIAAVPTFLPTQGVIRDNTGTPVYEGVYSVLFTLYDAPDATVPLWIEAWPATNVNCGSEPQMCVQVTQGVFHVELGSHVPLSPSVFSSAAMWLGISVEGEPELPRTRLGTTAYAFVAASAEYAIDAGYLMGQSPSDFEPAGAAQEAVAQHELASTHLTLDDVEPTGAAASAASAAVATHEAASPHLTAAEVEPAGAVAAHEAASPHLTTEQHQALTGGPASIANDHHTHGDTGPSLPAGMIAFFPGSACPPGWAEYAPLRGRLVVGVSAQDAVGAQVGVALGDQGTRSITDVPAHSHSIDPPGATSATSSASHTHSMAHTHSVDPPSTSTNTTGNHSHNLDSNKDGLVKKSVGGDGHPSFTTQGGNTNLLAYTTSDGNHSHSVNIGGFNSGGSSAGQTGGGGSSHNHAVDISAFNSASAGSAAVDVTMPYLQLLACQLQ